ncbi:MAG: hypothetical protein M0026_09805 [Nocardiopsaceae bacterium]|nr:hypothetical protein [Nocardiopsaceae bacterium]
MGQQSSSGLWCVDEEFAKIVAGVQGALVAKAHPFQDPVPEEQERDEESSKEDSAATEEDAEKSAG